MVLKKIRNIVDEETSGIELFFFEVNDKPPRPLWTSNEESKEEMHEFLGDKELSTKFLRITDGSIDKYMDVFISQDDELLVIGQNRSYKIKDKIQVDFIDDEEFREVVINKILTPNF